MKASVLAVLLALAATASIGSSNVLDVAKSVPELSTLVGAIKAAGLENAVASLTTGTVLAPTNDAFVALLPVLKEVTGLPISSLADIPTDALVETLLYHVLPEQYSAEELLGIQPAELSTLLTNATIALGVEGTKLHLIPSSGYSPADVTKADVPVPGTKVTVHLINNVLIPIEALL